MSIVLEVKVSTAGAAHRPGAAQPHPHARIVSIDTSKAEALPGVKAVVTRDDFADQSSEFIPAGEMMMNYKDVVQNVMAREKALYEGHAVAAIAATEPSPRRSACSSSSTACACRCCRRR